MILQSTHLAKPDDYALDAHRAAAWVVTDLEAAHGLLNDLVRCLRVAEQEHTSTYSTLVSASLRVSLAWHSSRAILREFDDNPAD